MVIHAAAVLRALAVPKSAARPYVACWIGRPEYHRFAPHVGSPSRVMHRPFSSLSGPPSLRASNIKRIVKEDLISVKEMLRIEKGGDEQVKDELEAYKDLIPQGNELVGCLMFEIENPEKRRQFLQKMAGSEHDTAISFAGQVVAGKPINDNIDRTHETDGRTSAVHFLRWSFTPQQVAQLQHDARDGGNKVKVSLSMNHKLYPHSTVLSDELVHALLADLTV